MPNIGGIGLGLNGNVFLNLSRSQAEAGIDVRRLSSGLRINSAADDPAGLAIAEKLQAQVNGYDQASENIQVANNALTVADGALQTISDILQRLRSLSVEANNDFLTAGDRNNLQTESAQLQTEINNIAANTSFNGVQLLNAHPYRRTDSLQLPDGTFATTTTSNPTGPSWNLGSSGGFGHQFIWTASNIYTSFNAQSIPSGSAQVVGIQGTQNPVFQNVNGFVANTTYALTFNILQAYNGSSGQEIKVYVDGAQVGDYAPIPMNAANPDWQPITTAAFTPGAGTHTISFSGNQGSNSWALMDNVQLQVVAGPDPGGPPQTSPTVSALQVGAGEGNTLTANLPTVFTANLRISLDNLATTAAATTYQVHIDAAIDAISGARAAIGAQTVALQTQATNNNIAAVNLAASESNIRDVNVAQTAAALAAEQMLSSIGTSLLANSRIVAASVEKLFDHPVEQK